MRRRVVGRSGVDVSVVGFGTVKIGRTQGMKYPEAYELPSDSVLDELLAVAADDGVTLIDTAPAYEVAEERLGEALSRRGDRERWVLSTKVGEEFDGERSSFDFSPETVTASVERSLRRLRTDRVEIVLVHSDGVAEVDLESRGTLDALRELKRRGLVRAIGVSVKTEAGAVHAIEAGVDCLMIVYSPAEPGMRALIERCGESGVGVLVKKALASGHLGKLGAEADPVEAALRFALATPGVTSVVVGTANPAHWRANLAAARRAMEA